MKLITDEKALNLSIQLLENDKLIKEQMIADNIATKEELTNLNNVTKQELLSNTDAVKQELQEKAPINNPDFKGSLTVDGKNVALSSEVDNKINEYFHNAFTIKEF